MIYFPPNLSIFKDFMNKTLFYNLERSHWILERGIRVWMISSPVTTDTRPIYPVAFCFNQGYNSGKNNGYSRWTNYKLSDRYYKRRELNY